ncbi:unnamed protein product [Didymodactylos carnosus]|uniref:Uncharacterized protein n=1 Tax=Didymodactylos carnosus TaxID=1234261 RepID=A0A813W7S0_9BILA|nr:unnamed protein product [Didymodactylos carnosus]CAF1524758.1 unnamed protein product [Didymodactylos carnosus]CAF3641362.1 unnamed protein product [Didymodactylos carnosus]CAF4311476.1 unnamed protein product [Didymodactylos carnosus]
MLCSTVNYHGANMHPGNTNSEVLYSTNGTKVPDFWSGALNSAYDDGIYDGGFSNRDILHPFITSEPLSMTYFSSNVKSACLLRRETY